MEGYLVKYFKSTISENDICKRQPLNQSRDFLEHFLNYGLAQVNYYFKTRRAIFSGRTSFAKTHIPRFVYAAKIIRIILHILSQNRIIF